MISNGYCSYPGFVNAKLLVESYDNTYTKYWGYQQNDGTAPGSKMPSFGDLNPKMGYVSISVTTTAAGDDPYINIITSDNRTSAYINNVLYTNGRTNGSQLLQYFKANEGKLVDVYIQPQN